VTLSRDQRGPGASLRLLPVEPPPLDRLGLGPEVEDWLDDRGLIVVAGPSGAGKTTTLASLVKALGDRQRRVVALEDPIEIAHVSPWVSQRALGDHVTDVTAGVTSAMAEGADAIVIGEVTTATAAQAVVDAVAGGHLVLTTLVAPLARVAVERMVDRLGAEQRELARALVTDALLGTIGLSRAVGGQIAFEVVGRGRAS
jgi:twitching motility protein PilT